MRQKNLGWQMKYTRLYTLPLFIHLYVELLVQIDLKLEKEISLAYAMLMIPIIVDLQDSNNESQGA